MLTRDDFLTAIGHSMDRYPTLGGLYRVRDPRLLQHLEAMATMLALYSAQLEVAMAEPFEKVRDATVLADACRRGLVPQAKPARATLQVVNAGTVSVSLASGRGLVDTAGRLWSLDAPATVPAGGAVQVEASQLYAKRTVHTVTGSRPFYPIPLSLADDESALCGVNVRDSSGPYTWRDRYLNTWPGEPVYHIEADEQQRVYLRFGQDGVVGVQPRDGAEITITSYYTRGNLTDLREGVPLTLSQVTGPADSRLTVRLVAVLTVGEDPPSLLLLRELSKYPSVYNRNAVFLGEFDFLIRSHFPSLQFLSVWNEGVEELHRGPSLSNVNALFIACLSADETVLTQPGCDPVVPRILAEEELSATQRAIREVIVQADDTYRVRFYAVVRAPYAVTLRAEISSAYDEGTVYAQIRQVMLDAYGEASTAMRRGQAVPLYQQVYQLLRERVPALRDGQADIKVELETCPGVPRPELWRYLTPDTLTVTVTGVNLTVPGWGAGWGTAR